MSKKKSFNADLTDALSPAMQFISSAEPKRHEAEPPQSEADEPTENPPDGCYVNPACIEKKSRRLQLLVRPGLYERLKRRAVQSGVSVNEAVNAMLEQALKEE